MKRWVLVLFIFILLSGRKGNKEVLTDLSEFPDNSFNISTIEKVDCCLGGGCVYIDDGDILFCFIDEDDTNHMISFLTSEHYSDGEKYYKVREREKLLDLMDKVRDYYQMEVEDGE